MSGTAVIIGGSIAGLFAGILLRRQGWRVEIYERVPDALTSRGAGIATHDEHLVCKAEILIDRLGLKPDRYEFQMLLGVDEELRAVLLKRGHRLRVYVPYGGDWYPYSVRRLRENPEVAQHVIRATLGLGATRR